MFLKTIGTYIHLQFLSLAESIMAAPPPSNTIFLFPPKKTRRFEVDSWADYALRETSYALSTATIINKVTHRKSTRDVAHEFLIVEMELQQPPRTTYLVTDRGPTKTNRASPPLPSTPPTPSRGSGSMASLFAIVDADDRVRVPENGLKANLELFALSEFGRHNEVCTLHWPRENSPPQMSAAQLAVLLSAVHAYNDQYAANGNSCYWYAYTVMEVIRTKFVAVQTEGSAFAERSMFARKKMDVEGDVEAVSKLYDTEWAKCSEQAQQRAVSSVNFYFVNFAGSNVS